MNKKEKTTTKIISKMIFFLFVISLFGFTLPAQTSAENSMSSFYANPNQSSSSGAYKFKISDVVNSNLLTNVVGCTGVVNKVSSWMVKFIQSPVQQSKILADKLVRYKESLKSACSSIKAAAQTAGQLIPTIGGTAEPIATAMDKTKVDNVKVCQNQVESTDPKLLEAQMKATEKADEVALKEQCFDGIAITLAKNQLTAMTRSAMNWVNSGWGGNPFFVQNMTNFVSGIQQNVVETGIDILLSPDGNQSPYAKNFAKSTVTGMDAVSSSAKFLGNLTSDLESFITDPQSYYTNDELNSTEDTRSALQRAEEANNMFANDFSVGGWDGWMALTQRDQNNPLGFTMLANDYLANIQANKVSEIKDELAQNNGFLSQKTCIKWNDDEKKALQEKLATLIAKEKICTNNEEGACDIISLDIDSANTKIANFVRVCTDYKTITPGSIIRDKTTNYLNSPERQLELAKTINDSLNALFSVLISQLEKGGLSGLSDSATNTTNWTDSTNSFNTVDGDGNSTYDNGGAYNNFNLTRDLGNTYIYENITKLGTWNANANTATLENSNYLLKFDAANIKLYPDTPPEVYQTATDGEVELTNNLYGNLVNPINGYYTVGTSGKTKIITAGNNTWEKGDRAFWNGSEWQNWKCYKSTTINKSGPCDNQLNPIKKRGVVQIQNDYIVAGREILGELDQIMPKIGELDYCLPGPNPNYQINSTDAQSAYQDWVGSMYTGIIDNTGSRYGVKIDKTDGDRTYANLKSIYTDNLTGWGKILGPIVPGSSPASYADTLETTKFILSPMNNLIFTFSNICNASKNDCTGNYMYTGGEPTDTEANVLGEKTQLMNRVLDYVNNTLFQDFYKIFDKEMADKYFKKMTNVYNDTETSIGLDTNDYYIPMAESGLDITKDIIYYNDDVVKAKKDYTDAISIARVNISKLDPIKSEVSGIIKAAQDRRDARLLEILKNESVRNGTPILTANQYKTKYIGCLDEENIQFYDADKITAMGSANEENCKDGIDNDLDGLIDSLDHKDCDGVATSVPSTPTDLGALTGTCGENWLKIIWSPVIDPTVKNYRVYRDGGTTPIYEGKALSFLDKGLVLGSEHTYKISAVNNIGASALSAPTSRTVSNACVYTLTYNAGPGGKIFGRTPQNNIAVGTDGTPVTANPVTLDGAIYTFSNWSDGLTTATRTDKNVTKDITVKAWFKKGQTVNPDYLQ